MSKSFLDDRCKIWSNLLSAQVDLFSPAEFATLEALPLWQAARSVADVGCGHGDYIALLERAFPEKRYVGFDTSGALINLARQKFSSTGISFHNADISEAAIHSEFDAAILRFVVQHLEDPTSFFQSLKSILVKDGFVVIIEPDLNASTATPELVGFRNLVTAYDEVARARGSTRARIQDPDGLQHLLGHDWSVMAVKSIQSRHDCSSWNKCTVREVIFGWVDAIEASQSVSWDYARLKQEIHAWLETTGQGFDVALTATIISPKHA